MMGVRLEYDLQSDGYKVWFYRRDPFRVIRYVDDVNSWMEFTVEPDVDAEPSMFLRSGMLEALLVEAEKVIPASHATERHLLDAIAVRDRLLGLVEEGWHE